MKEGSIIEGPFWPEPVEIKKIEKIGEYIHIIGASIHSKSFIEQLIPESEIDKIRVRETTLNFTSDGLEAFLAVEAIRFKFASLFDPLLAMNVSKIDPLPFQIEAVYGYILKLPKIRFLIADDPGAGKTIMAGLVIKELKLRRLAHRILIVVPGHLKDQWIRELKEKFQETFTLIDRYTFRSLYGENPWQRENQVITSIDFAKQEEILPSLSSVFWDLVIVDEAHKMAAYKYGDKTSKTERYRLGEVLSRNSKNLLFLTATPHKGDPENFRLFLDLLEPGFFATTELIEESLKNRDNPLFIRRLKEDLKDFEGRPIFTNRYPKTIKFRLSDEEKNLYNELSKYVISQYNKALLIDKKRNVAFALLILQRRMASSTYALFKSLERRKERLENLLEEPDFEKRTFLIEFEEVEDYDEKERWEEEKKWETLTLAENKKELEEEIAIISKLMDIAKEIVNNEKEVKLKELKKAIEEGLKKIKEIQGNEKILIFTESKDTLEYLVSKIKSWGYSVNFIHGGMSLEERIKAEKTFRDETQIMVATEAAGEGINLQFCHIMINYDIPWNPNRLEQRMGRIHRYGQQKDVYMFNLVAEDTREGEVLSKILDKLEEIRNALGSDKVFDVIGDVFYGKNLYQLILEAVANARNLDEIIKDLDIRIDEEYIQKIKESLGESLATRYIDYTRIKEMAEKAKEYRLIPEYVEEFFKKAFEKAGGKFKVRRDGFLTIESIPYELKKIAEDFNFKNKYGIISKSYPKATFDKEIAFKNPDAEFISFGHPLLEALIEWINKKYLENLQLGAVFEDPSGRYDGVIWFFEGEVKDGKGDVAGKSIMAIYQDDNGMKEVNPAILWDLVPKKQNEDITLKFTKEQVRAYAIGFVEEYKKKILEERKRQAEIKEKYGVKSLEYYIGELDQEILELQERKEKGENVDIAIRNKEEQKRRYEEALKNLKKEIEQEINLTISMPQFLGAILVRPSSSPEMVGDEEIERIGMEIAMRYEKEQGREPEDVSKENLGFDIRSKGKGEIRYIEVKARKDEGPVALTSNEYFKAKRFKEQYWLYVVANATSSPKLYLINNPAENLKFEEKIEVVRFIVSPQEWKNKGEKV
ncbi:helicase-related protein [Candidatus Kryptobacter tengchongensis]|uniref:Superfamily II DNA or RNA helicase, SNF2 family n=1 Tax=Kryptobacter tengchongensis TaxID=1643429 RepID=A0A916LJU3_KRYT1|nr:helicase-related protein [Candidatus Kryptobacter tengchongensis]CUT01677.1 Superfamily II DNA or RNA helicase, SNF2 family [Candidatus Kryptobacter tengchongensis]